jgi:hypothetical protein
MSSATNAVREARKYESKRWVMELHTSGRWRLRSWLSTNGILGNDSRAWLDGDSKWLI